MSYTFKVNKQHNMSTRVFLSKVVVLEVLFLMVLLIVDTTHIAQISIPRLTAIATATGFEDHQTYELRGHLWNEMYGYTALGPADAGVPPSKIQIEANVNAGGDVWNIRGCSSQVFCYLPYTKGSKSYGVSMQKISDTRYNLYGYAWNSNAGWISFGSNSYGETTVGNKTRDRSAQCMDRDGRARVVKEGSEWILRGCAKVVNNTAPLGRETIYLGPNFRTQDSRLKTVFNTTDLDFKGHTWGQKTGLWSFGRAAPDLPIVRAHTDDNPDTPSTYLKGGDPTSVEITSSGDINDFKAEPEVVTKGKRVKVSWNTKKPNKYDCTLKENSIEVQENLISKSSQGDIVELKVERPIEVDTLFSLACSLPTVDTGITFYPIRKAFVRIRPTQIQNR